MKTCALIYNPVSGKKTFKKQVPYVKQKLEEAGYEVFVYATDKPKDATRITKTICKANVDLLVISGGDGTFHECLNGFTNCKQAPKVGYIPSGTSCDLASTLKIPKNVSKALDIILNGESVLMDFGKTNKGNFIYVMAIGTYVDISYVTDSKLKKYLGYLAYLITGIKEFFTIPIIKADIEYDEGQLSGHYSLILIVNSKKVAGFNIVNKPILDDGLVDVVIYKYIPFFNNLLYFISFLFNPKYLPGVKKIQTKKLKIHTNHPLKWNMDGEEAEIGSLDLQVEKQVVPLIINPSVKHRFFRNQPSITNQKSTQNNKKAISKK
jgi:diacylglycerol kinase (ATP)